MFTESSDHKINDKCEIISRVAVVTGASSGIGLAISKKLLENGYRVYGIGRNFDKKEAYTKENRVEKAEDNADYNDDFVRICLDMLDTEELVRRVEAINSSENVSVLVNNAGVGYYGLHEQLKIEEIQAMVRTNLEVPMILSKLLLKNLKRNNGYIVNISSHTAKQANPHGCAYGATKAGLSGFSKSLFAEERKYGLHVVNIEPDMTATNLYRNSDFGVDTDEQAYLLPEEVAETVMFALSQRDGCNLTDIALEPQINRILRKKG